MKRHESIYYTDDVLIKGYVRYEDEEPVKNAIVILEQIFVGEYPYECNANDKVIYATYTTTNRYGEFYFLIDDKRKYYKIKVFDTHYNVSGKHTCNMNVCL